MTLQEHIEGVWPRDNERLFISELVKKWIFNQEIRQEWGTPVSYIIMVLADLLEQESFSNSIAKSISAKIVSTLEAINQWLEDNWTELGLGDKP
jgi:hypothetical protein